MTDDEHDPLFDAAGTGDADPLLAKLEAELHPARYVAVDPKVRADGAAAKRRAIRRRSWLLGGTAALALAATVALLLRPAPAPSPIPFALPAPSGGLAVAVLRGAPRIDARPISGESRLGVGAWLETDGASAAEVTLPIGSVRVAPGSRVRIVATARTEHRLELTRGAIDALVIAPPRLFVVDTPAARAVDLGCAYRLEVGDDGAGTLHVRSGAVELIGGEGSDTLRSWVPAGAVCETRPGRGPGAPYYEDALDELKVALRRIDEDPRHPAPGTIEALVSAARKRDTLTLWHLRGRVDAASRHLIEARMSHLAPGTTEAGIEEAVTHW